MSRSRDYVKKYSKSKKTNRLKRFSIYLIILGVIAVTVGFLVSPVFHFLRAHGRMLVVHTASVRQNYPPRLVHFDFYSDTTDAKTTEMPQFFLTLGTFHSLTEASQLRISLLLSGEDVDVVHVVDGASMLYRVLLGPYPNEAKAKLELLRLHTKGVEAEIMGSSLKT